MHGKGSGQNSLEARPFARLVCFKCCAAICSCIRFKADWKLVWALRIFTASAAAHSIHLKEGVLGVRTLKNRWDFWCIRFYSDQNLLPQIFTSALRKFSLCPNSHVCRFEQILFHVWLKSAMWSWLGRFIMVKLNSKIKNTVNIALVFIRITAVTNGLR